MTADGWHSYRGVTPDAHDAPEPLILRGKVGYSRQWQPLGRIAQ